jgi:peptidoglycan/LPS O-acetylase OafA/YrhL
MTESRGGKRPHWPALDGWRGLTIWVAICVHAGYFTAGGVLSLDTFFVLSGFLITGLLLGEWERSDRIDLPAFWARRARRLLPALFVVLGAVLAYAAFLASPVGLDQLRGDVVAALGYVVNWHFLASGQSYFSAFTTPSPVLHLWSLAVEEQFYLLWPPIVLGVLTLARRRMARLATIAMVGVIAVVGACASAITMAVLYRPGGDPSRVYYGTDTRAQAMLVGAALAVVVELHGPLRSWIGRSVLSLATPVGFAIVVAPWFATNATWTHDLFYGHFGLLAYSVATAVVIWRLAQPAPGVLGRGLAWGPVRAIGNFSYEMYLWHWPTYLVLTPQRVGSHGLALLATRLSVVVVLAWATHRMIEEPIRRGVRLRSPTVARAAAVIAVAALGTAVFAATVGAQPALRGDVGQVADRNGPPTIPERVTRPNPSHPAPVDGSVPPAPLKVLVVGDSQAATLAQGVHADPGVYGLSARPGLAVWNRAILGCPIIRAPWFMIDGERQQNRCGGSGLWERQWTSDVATFQPNAVVVLAGAWDVFDVADPDGTVEHPGDPAWTLGYERDLSALLDTLAITGAPIVAIKPPCWGESELAGTDPERPERLDVSRVAAVDAAWQTVVKSHRARLLDLDRVLCPGGQSDAGIRPDGAHFDGAGANRVAPLVADAIRLAVTAR